MRRLTRAVATLAGRIPGKESIYLADRFPDETIGRGSYGGLTILKYDSENRLRIGSFCSFAADVTVFLGGDHRMDWITTYPFNVLDQRFADITGHPRSKGDVVIGNDVWLGRGAVILSGVTVGNGAAIGAYAVVTKDVPPYGIVAGNPAKLLRLRFSEKVIEELQRIRWWDWPDERLDRAVPYLQSDRIDEFLSLVRSGEL
jgi:acetyltransferase-like isoleucine patch superfamily enzyme